MCNPTSIVDPGPYASHFKMVGRKGAYDSGRLEGPIKFPPTHEMNTEAGIVHFGEMNTENGSILVILRSCENAVFSVLTTWNRLPQRVAYGEVNAAEFKSVLS